LYLSREEERALQGERGDAVRWAMEMLVRKGVDAGAERLVPISSVHIPDWYGHRSSGEWQWLATMAGMVDVPVTANPGGPDDELSAARKTALSTLRPNSPYTFSCAPFLAGNHPAGGTMAAWGGRAAVSFANSVLGARSETEDFSSALASAITGLTAERGLLLEENRRPTIGVRVVDDVGRDVALLGQHLSRVVGGHVPAISGFRSDFDGARRFAFAVNGEGRVPMFHLCGPKPPAGLDLIEVKARECREPAQDLESPDLLILGCPHLSEQEINRWGRHLAGRRPGRTEAWFFTSKLCLDKCPLTGALLASRGRVMKDMCPLWMTGRMSGRAVGCDSPALASCLSASGVNARPLSQDELSHLMASEP
jgi:predicted aconitase